jgi:sodium-dependent phosphate cotransporter
MGLAYFLCGPPPTEVKDAYAADYNSDEGKKWNEMDGGEKVKHVALILLKLCVVLGSLYMFICSLSFLANGFRLIAGRQAGEVFRNNVIFDNPIAGCLVGVLVTVLVQSSSTSTSIVITMVAADLFSVRQAISLIMGANIGTSVTSTIVALGQVGDKEEFRKAFAAATVHDMFNFCTVLVLLPLEAISGYLYAFSSALIPDDLKSGEKPPDFLKVITKPFTKIVMSVDKKLITKIAAAKDEEELAELSKKKLLKHFFGNETMDDTVRASSA